MKIQILQENLNKGLGVASRSISSKVQLPILANVLIKTDQNRLKISATNLETGVSLWLGGKVEEEGEITVPARILTEIVSSLPAEKIDLLVNENSLKISCEGFSANINGISASEFPKLPVYSPESLFVLPAEKLSEAINQVAFAAASDDGRPVLTGVLFKIQGKTLSMVATDGYRLSLKTIELDSPVKEEVKLLLPARTLMEVSKIISEEKAEKGLTLQMGFTKEQNQVVFVFPEMELFSRVIEGEFPDYEKIIPENSETKVILDKESLARAVKLVSIFARESANIVKMNFKDSFLEMSANSPQVGENKNQIEVSIEGEGGEIAFNYRFLQGFLGAVTGKDISFSMTGSLNPGVFKIAQDESFLHVIMPVRLQTE
ncbi:DNA polymerase III subunit beta [Candidatus Microgenomates bacterium]|jgi:DNA polymerase-3 subunit beta|nr:MAG: DNA polymerase III subunit beta [Candidatus Microgenomates bacterium]